MASATYEAVCHNERQRISSALQHDAATTAERQTLSIRLRDALVEVGLGDSAARNALCDRDHRLLGRELDSWARDPELYAVFMRSDSPGLFSIGSDVREMLAASRSDAVAAARLLRNWYELYWQVDCFTKPIVSFIDGHCAGAASALVLGGTHRIGTPQTQFYFSEVSLGLAPQGGQAFHLARLPSEIGMYLALTGRGVGAADGLAFGLLTHIIEARFQEHIASELAKAEPVDPILDGLAREPGPRDLDLFAETIQRCFSADSVEEIIERLRGERSARAPWVDSVVRDIGRHSPLALKASHRLVRLSRMCDLRQTLLAAHNLSAHLVAEHDFEEGVRAALIDGDRQPRWKHRSLAAVTTADVDALFSVDSGEVPHLPTREEMQMNRRRS